MGTPIGRADSAVILEELAERPGSFEFFQLVRLIEREGLQPRFHANPSLSFPASQTHSLTYGEDGVADVGVNFLGLVGPMGVLPYFYSELVGDRGRAKDHGLAAFLDIFHHRATRLFYDAWRTHRFPVPWEQREEDGVTSALRAVLGLRTPGLAERQGAPDSVLLFHAGLLGLASRPALALEQLLASHFEVPVEVVQFTGCWSMLPEAHQCRLGSESISEQLGMGTIAGDAIWDQQSQATLRLGPMPLARYRDFLPGGPAHRDAVSLTQFFANRQCDFALQLLLDRDEVPDFELGTDLPLGWCSWLKTEAFPRHPDDAILPLGEPLCL